MGKNIFCFCFLVISNHAFSQFKLDIVIDSLRNNKGNVMLQLFDSSQKILRQEMNQIDKERCYFSIPGLAPGKYAVRYYHDENLNARMETNFVGKPTEGFGFSNNVTGKYGPPPFSKWLFELSGNKRIVLKPTY